MSSRETGCKTVHANQGVNSDREEEPTLDALVFVMLRCLRAFDPYSNENTVLGEVLSYEGDPSSAELWKASVIWGVRELRYEIFWPVGKEWLGLSGQRLARSLLSPR